MHTSKQLQHVSLALLATLLMVGPAVASIEFAGVDDTIEGVPAEWQTPTIRQSLTAHPEKVPLEFWDRFEFLLDDGLRVMINSDSQPALQALLGDAPTIWMDEDAIAVIAPEQLPALLAHPAVRFVEPDYPAVWNLAVSVPDVNGRGDDAPWDLDYNTFPGSLTPGGWAEAYTGKGVTVAVVDSGIDGTHRDFGGFDCTDWMPYQPCDSRIKGHIKVSGHLLDLGVYPEMEIPAEYTNEFASGHGTHVAGTIAGNGYRARESADAGRYGNDGIPVGVAPEADLFDISNGDTLWAGLGSNALWWLTRHHEEYGIKVASNSWGCLGGCEFSASSTTSQYIQTLFENDVVVVFATGNDGSGAGSGDTLSANAESPYAIGVANYDAANHRVASSSSRGKANQPLPDPATWTPQSEGSNPYDRPDIAAPGTGIWSAATLTGGAASVTPRVDLGDALGGGATGFVPYRTMSGTSMATPHVSGAAAVLFDACPDASALDVFRALFAGANPDLLRNTNGAAFTTANGAQTQGYGALDVAASLSWIFANTACDGGDPVDSDGDGILDSDDNCPTIANADQADADGDGIGDVCDADDNDGPDGDTDGDGVRNADDVCEGFDDNVDSDGDGTPDGCDNGDPTGDGTYYFDRGDALLGNSGNAWAVYSAAPFALKEEAPAFVDPAVIHMSLLDGANGGFNQFYDPAVWISADGFGGGEATVTWWMANPATGAAYLEVLDVDVLCDGARIAGAQYTSPSGAGGAPTEYTATIADVPACQGKVGIQIDPNNSASSTDYVLLYDTPDYPSRVVFTLDDADTDGDGILDSSDNCPTIANADQADADGDHIGDACDADDNDGPDGDTDNDGVRNADDVCEGFNDGDDIDGDGIPDGCDDDNDDGPDGDADGDGVRNADDVCPGFDDNVDSDGDGTPDGCDGDPRIAITSHADGETVEPDFVLSGSATTGGAQQSWRVPDLSTIDNIGASGIVWEPWMSSMYDRFEALDGFRGMLPADGVITVLFDGDAPAIEGRLTNGWAIEVRDHATPQRQMVQLPEPVQIQTGILPGVNWNEAITPGAQLYMDFDGDGFGEYICTSNFVWKDHVGDLYLGAAGHCFLPSSADATQNVGGSFDPSTLRVFVCTDNCWGGGYTGSLVYDFVSTGIELGDVVYSRQTNGVEDIGHDFGLIRIPTEHLDRVDPGVPFFGGPDAVMARDNFNGDLLIHHGNGAVVAETTATKSRVGVSLSDGDPNSWTAVHASYGGDSGSAVQLAQASDDQGFIPYIPDGQFKASGLLTHGICDPLLCAAGVPGLAWGTTVERAIDMATEAGLCIRPLLGNEDPATAPAAEETDDCRTTPPPFSGVEISIDGGDWAAADSGNGVWSFNVTGLGEGDHTLDARLVDAGSEVARDSITVTVGIADSDGDGVPDDEDVCPGHNDFDDIDGDTIPDGCDDDDNDGPDGDTDGDGVRNADDACEGFNDADDLDGDTIPDGCDDQDNRDSDGDGVENWEDAFPDDSSEWSDRDGDGVGDNSDAFPDDASEWSDADGDGVGDNSDACPGHDDGLDQDGDGTPNHCDDDVDGDGRPNDQDNDSDGDGHPDGKEIDHGTDPYDPGSFPDGPNGAGNGKGNGPKSG